MDNQLSIKAWRVAGQAEREDMVAALSEPGAPSWWLGEEDASQTFLHSQGVILPDAD